jgi:hypothetical protein
MTNQKSKRSKMQWFLMDLHIHTPASADFQEKGASYLDILHRAEMRSLDIVAFTDHNTIGGYSAMMAEIEQLAYLARLGRVKPDEKHRLQEYRRLLDKTLLLPGFEFTATFGFHLLGIFSPQTTVRELEHILLSLNIPPQVLDEGTSNVGASTDVLTAYRIINEQGGIVIAAHANSSHGVADRRRDFGGQTRIAYTQDANLHALEVTDLERRGRSTTARFFDGSKPEYPRRMRCIQGSDSHRVSADPKNPKKNPGVGDRVTEVLLPEPTFEALLEMFRSNDFARTRPYRTSHAPFDHVQAAREEGESIVQAFHESATRRGGRLYAVLSDICAFANTNGGTVYLGVSANPKEKPAGVENVQSTVETVRHEVDTRIAPEPDVEIDTQETQGKAVIRIRVPLGEDPPYVIDDSKVYVRDETETNLAVRDEMVRLVLRSRAQVDAAVAALAETGLAGEGAVEPPRTGVEIVGTEERKGTKYHIMRDLRNGNIVQNVTRASARRLWRYAITEKESKPVNPDEVTWHGEIGLWKKRRRGGVTRYDLVQRGEGGLRVYYGVTNDGIHGPWAALVGEGEEAA